MLITGVMAAGTSTVAQLLAESLPRAVHVCGDVFRRMIVFGRAEPAPDEAEEARRRLDLRQPISTQVADAYADDGWTAVVQDIVLGEDLPRYVDRVRTRPPHVVVLAPPPETVRELEEGRGKTGSGAWNGRGVRRVPAQRDAPDRAVAGHLRPDARGDGFGHPPLTGRVSRRTRAPAG